MNREVTNWMVHRGIPENVLPYVLNVASITGILILMYLADLVAKRIIFKGITVIIKKSRTSWGKILLEKKILNRVAHIAPALVAYFLIPIALPETPVLVSFLRNFALIYMILITLLATNSFLDYIHDLYMTFEISENIPLKGIVQAMKIALFFIGGIIILSAVTDKTPLYFLSGLGALTAVLMLIFKDAILGFVAGIQLSANDMVRQGDWIEMPQFGADGDVLDVALTTVKVQNWDKTITTIPTYALISQSFKNWRGMEESGGRRIKRSLYIDMTTIKFCDEEMLERFAKIDYISEYIDLKKREIEEWNRERGVDTSSSVNVRRLTNVGTFRAYVEAYLRNHPKIHQNMTFLIRQLQPADHGLPLEIYVFSNDQVWARYESIQSDVFDHLLAIIPEFDLRVFQNPSGADFRELGK